MLFDPIIEKSEAMTLLCADNLKFLQAPGSGISPEELALTVISQKAPCAWRPNRLGVAGSLSTVACRIGPGINNTLIFFPSVPLV